MQHSLVIVFAPLLLIPVGFMIIEAGTLIKNSIVSISGVVVACLFLPLSILMVVFSQSPTDKQIKLLQQAPVRTISIKTYDLVSAQSAGFVQTTVNGGAWSISGTTNDATSYRYIVKSGDSYQVKTLHDQFGDVNANDVYVKQEPGRKNAQLVVETKEYEDPQVRRLIDHTSWASKWQTYTFKVGEDSINTKSEFK